MQPTINEEANFPLNEHIKDEYRILRLVGIGGMGNVYLAEQLHVGRRHVALKLLNAACSEDPEMVQRFQNEAASAGRINHQNVVTIHECRLTADGQLYVAMEYVEGKTLTMLLQEEGALPLARVVNITKQLCAGLAAAHKLGIVHRDIKPENIMIVDDDGEEVVKVLDFGLARISEAISYTKRTQAGIIMGTPEYMSPEQAMGRTGDNIDARSDIYSVAMVVYELLTGRPAFSSENPFDTIKQHITEKPMPLRHWKPDLQIPDAVERVLMKALEKDRDKRQQTIGEFAREFVAAASDREQRSSAKTSLFAGAGNVKPSGEAQSPANPPSVPSNTADETIAVGSIGEQAMKPEDTNKTSLLGAKTNSPAPASEDVNKTTLLGANAKRPVVPPADTNKTSMLGAQTTQPNKPVEKQSAPPTAGNANETIAFGAKSSPPVSPPPAYETVADVASFLNAGETQAFIPGKDVPAGFSKQSEQPPAQGGAAQGQFSEGYVPPLNQLIKDANRGEQPSHQAAYASPSSSTYQGDIAPPKAPKKGLWIAIAGGVALLVIAAIVWFVVANSSRTGTTKSTSPPSATSANSLVDYRIRRENPTADMETLGTDNQVKAGEGFGFEVKVISPGTFYLFSEESDKKDGSWRWLNASRPGETPTAPVGEWLQIPFGDWLYLTPGVSEEKFMLIYVPRNVAWTPASVGVNNSNIKKGTAEVPRETAASLKAYLQREAAPLNASSEVRDKSVRFSLSKEGADNRPLFTEFLLKLSQ